jgi:hypothetical protein
MGVSEISPSEKATKCMIPFVYLCGKGNTKDNKYEWLPGIQK